MKKISTLFLSLIAVAFSAMGQSFTDELHVFINGIEAGHMESTILVTKDDAGKYTLSLKNFVLSAGEDAMYVGNVVVPDIAGTPSDGGILLEKTATINIVAGDEPADAQWIGPALSEQLGGIPVTISAVLADKLTADITIDLSAALGQQIKVTFGKGTQTGIKETTAVADKKADTVYNLSGQRIARPRKGICIVGGKKMLCR